MRTSDVAASDQPALIDIQALTKRFGAFTAVDTVSFQVRRGEVLGLLGPNGAGKSTTLRMLTGYLPATAGTARILDHDVHTDTAAARQGLGYLPERAPAYPEMPVEGFLRLCGRVRGFSGSELADRVDRALDLTMLQAVRFQAVETLSKGYKRRTGLAGALLHDPSVLVLDDPAAGLDLTQRIGMRRLIQSIAPDKAIVISTHSQEEVAAVCTRAIVLASGRIVADARPRDLPGWHPSGQLDDVFQAVTGLR